MKSQPKLSLLSLALSPLLAMQVSVVNAQALDTEKAQVKNKDVERITVTSTRREYLDTDLAMSVIGVNKAQIELDNGQHLAESLNSISGVLIDQLSGGQGHKTAIRMPLNVSGYYLFLQDNIPLQSPAFFNHNGLWWSSFNSHVHRMEVLKGAGTALHGSGAVAGTINILSEPIADKPVSSVSAMLGQDNYRKVQMSHSQKINDEQGFRVSASLFNTDNWRQHTGSKRYELSARHEWQINVQQSLTTSLIVSDLEQEMAGSLTKEQYVLDRSDSGLSATVLANDPLRKSQYVRLATEWRNDQGDLFYSVIPYLRYRTNDYTATWNANMPSIESEMTTLGVLALMNMAMDESELTTGLDIEITKGDQLSFQPHDFTTTGWNADTYVAGEKFYDDTTKYTSLSPYLQYRGQLTEQLDFTLGARYDYAKYDFDNHLGVYGDIGHGLISLVNRSDNFHHFSPKASLNYHIDQMSSVYLRYANSFRLPTASSLYHLTTKDDGEAKAVDPEVSDTYEVGYKLNLADVTLDMAMYYMDVDDGIVHAYNQTTGQRFLTNASRVVHKGVELDIDWRITDEFTINAAYSRSKHEFIEHDEFSGNEMKAAPDHLANLRFTYQPHAIAGLRTQLEVQSIGEYWLDDANSVDDDGHARIDPGYTIANVKMRYQVNEQLSLHARVLNVTDKDYIRANEYRFRKMRIAPGEPRTFYIGVNYQWD